MRTGQNPAKFIDQVGRPERITVAVVTYLPFLAGYFTEGLPVLQLCLESLRRNTAEAFDLMVFDNGSAPEVTRVTRPPGKRSPRTGCRRSLGRVMERLLPGVTLTDDHGSRRRRTPTLVVTTSEDLAETATGGQGDEHD